MKRSNLMFYMQVHEHDQLEHDQLEQEWHTGDPSIILNTF